MKKCKFFAITLAIFLAGVITASNFSPVSAAVTLTDHVNAYGSTVINVDGHPLIVFDGYHIDSGPLGSGDVFRIWYYTGLPAPYAYFPVAILTDMSQRISLFNELYVPFATSVQLVDSSAMEVSRQGMSKTMMVVWKTALEVPEERWGQTGAIVTPAMTIPPGRIIFRGHGDATTGSSNSVPSYPGQVWSQTTTWTGYYGDATFVCPTWDFGGPVGVAEGPYSTSIRTEQTIVSTKP